MPPETNTADNYIDDDSKWFYNDSKGEKLFGSYRPINEGKATMSSYNEEKSLRSLTMEATEELKLLINGLQLMGCSRTEIILICIKLYTTEKRLEMMDWMVEHLDASPAQLLSTASRISPMEEFEN